MSKILLIEKTIDLYWSEAYEYVLSKVKKFDNILAHILLATLK